MAGKMEELQNTAGQPVLKRLLYLTKPYRIFLVLAVISALISVTFQLLAPVLTGRAIDYVIGPGEVSFAQIAKILITLAVTIAVSAVFQWMLTFSTNKLTFYTVKDLRDITFGKLNQVPLRYIDSKTHGDVINTVVNDIDQVSDGLLQGFAQLFSGIVTIIGTLGFMLSINVGITVLVVVLTPLSFFVAGFIAKRVSNKFQEQSMIRGKLTGYINEMLGNQKIVKTFNYEARAQETFEAMNGKLYKCGVMAQFYSSLTNPCTRFVNGVVYAAVGIFGALSAISGRVSVGQLSSFLTYANQYTKPFNEIS
ncbi:MAG: ABC transporter ATP-binding protein, partial [Lachnospiraceae bacterium]|nr:ABC transporter ATP-binding protein [Lachnospiraceae bacterium]